MNLIGHNFVAKKVLDKYNSMIAAGSHLPDLVPFVKDCVFTFEEIHEGPEIVYSYLKNKNINTDLALGLMAHSVKFGADKFNRDIDLWLLQNNEDLKESIAKMVCQSSNVSMEIAKGPRMHNYLWCGFDFYIMDSYPEFIQEMNEAYSKINIPEVSLILSEAYKKPLNLVTNNVEKHIGLVTKNPIKTKLDSVKFWKEFVSELPEKDEINVNEAVKTFNYIEKQFSGQWEEIQLRVTADIKKRISRFFVPKKF